MSLVNDMLRDLQRRPQTPALPLAGLRAVPLSPRRAIAAVLAGAIALAIGFALASGVGWVRSHDDALPSGATLAAVSAPARSPVVGPPPADPLPSAPPLTDASFADEARASGALMAPSQPFAAQGAAAPDTAVRAAVVKRRPATIAQQAEEAFTEAVRLRRIGRSEDAAGELELALSMEPDHHPARESLASILVELGQFDAAGFVLEEGLALDPSHVPFAMLRARLVVEAGAVDAAVAILEATPPRTFDPEYAAFLAALLQRRGDHARAIELYSDVLRDNAGRAAWWMGLGISLEAERRGRDALRVYRTARAVGTLEGEPRAFVARRIRSLQKGLR